MMVHGYTSKSMYLSPNTMQNESSLSTGFHNVSMHKVHFLVGVKLTGGNSLGRVGGMSWTAW